ncbi:putative ATP-dependent RNA helicase DHX34 isoform X1 [Ciona intestinalis]
MDDFNWEFYRSELNKIFFHNESSIPNGSKKYEDFWMFFKRFRKYQAKHGLTNQPTEPNTSNCSERLGLPSCFSTRFKINCEVANFDEILEKRRHKSKKSTRPTDKYSEVDDGLTATRLKEFHSGILHYLDFCQKQSFQKLKKLKTEQSNLPIAQYRDRIIEAVKSSQVVIVAGDTGCGKSTQVPQYLLRSGFTNIACTQPRRIAAISLSKRVGFETLNQYGSQVAYKIRFEGTKTSSTRILFLTEGLLLRQMQQDGNLAQYSVIILDEIHERHLQSDLLLGLLRNLISSGNTELRLVLMSATINLELFCKYFEDSPVIQVPGRLYPIQVKYHPISLEDKGNKSSKLDPRPYIRILQKIDKKYPSSERGDLLIFLPGMQEITIIEEAAKAYAEETKNWIILPLHSTLSIEEQNKVFDIAPDGVRKCILSTNIAETSVTVDGVRFVADSGRVKEMSFDAQFKMKRLQEFWVSRASAEQRKGRAGRTGPGVCFRLYSEEDYEAFAEYSVPEIQRVPLDSLILQMKSMGIDDVRKFSFIEPPPESALNNAIIGLKEQEALGRDEEISPLGEMLAQLPVDVAIGKMLIMGSLFDVIEPVMSVASVLSVQSPYTRSAYNNPEMVARRRPIESTHGDPITLLNLFDEWIKVKAEGKASSRTWCKRRGLEEQRFYEMANIKRQFTDLLRGNALLSGEKESSHGRETSHKRKQRHADRKRLRQLKEEERTESRKRKVLKMTDHKYVAVATDDASDADDDETVSLTTNMKDLEFKVRHDLDKLYKASSEERNFTLKDVILLKVILCSGLYPQLAFPDNCNSYTADSDQVFHTKNKLFVVLHPNSYFANHPDILEPVGKDDDITEGKSSQRGLLSHKHQLLSYVSLLETTKPYLVNTMRVPTLQTLLLFSQSLDTDGGCKKIIVDEWIEICISDATQSQGIVASCLQLRTAWNQLLKLRINASKKEGLGSTRSTRNLQKFLGLKLPEFLDSKVEYKVRRITAADKKKLYVGPNVNSEYSNEEIGNFAVKLSQAVPHPSKGGIQLSPFLTYNCLSDGMDMGGDYLREFWTCPNCNVKLPLTVLERLRHQAICTGEENTEADSSSTSQNEGSTSIPSLQKDYHCDICNQMFKFSAVEILKHKRSHANQ